MRIYVPVIFLKNRGKKVLIRFFKMRNVLWIINFTVSLFKKWYLVNKLSRKTGSMSEHQATVYSYLGQENTTTSSLVCIETPLFQRGIFAN